VYKFFVPLFLGLFFSTLYGASEYIKQIKVWDECTYAMETIRIDTMQLKDKAFEDITPTEAIERCTQSLLYYPNDPHIKFLLARAYTKAKQYQKGFALTSKACESGDIGGCTLLAGYLDHRLVSKQEADKKSILLWIWSCSHDDAQACTNLYLKSGLHSNFIPQEFEGRKDKLLKLCQKGSYPLACHAYAKACFKDRLSSEACLYSASQSCSAGNQEGCLFYREFQKNNHRKQPKTAKQKIYQKSCNNGNNQACLKMAHVYASKKRTKLNNILALALYEDTCTKGHDATACRYAGSYYLAKLEGITQDIPKGIRYLEQSCKPYITQKESPGYTSTHTEYDIQGCLDLAKYYLYTPQTEYRDTQKAKKILKKACQLTQYYYTSKLGCQLQVDTCCKQLPSR